MAEKELIFVYNANSGAFSGVKDFFHRIISPSTYPCNLCQQTFGNFGMKDEWRDFIENLQISSRFLHKDEFQEEFGTKVKNPQFPCVYVKYSDKPLELFISADKMNEVQSLDAMKRLVKEALSRIKIE